ncbi:MAG: hypothetical protein U9O65_08310 [Thermotogota bacterium]|nr:hypothetical protein [Thermotogota bacterium]
MKKLFLALAFIFLFSSIGFADVWVDGYYRSDGTYVQGYYRSDPNNTVRDNYDYKGNINPYTGEEGSNHYRNNPSSEYYSPYKNSDSYNSTYSNPYDKKDNNLYR